MLRNDGGIRMPFATEKARPWDMSESHAYSHALGRRPSVSAVEHLDSHDTDLGLELVKSSIHPPMITRRTSFRGHRVDHWYTSAAEISESDICTYPAEIPSCSSAPLSRIFSTVR